MPIRPRSGSDFMQRHMKSCFSSSAEGALKANTWVTFGSRPRITCLTALSFPAPSIAWKMNSTDQRLWAASSSVSP